MTESKLRKQALEQSEDHLRLALRAARVGSWEWDFLTNDVTWSEGVEALFGLSKGSFPDTIKAFCQLVQAEDIGLAKDCIDRAMRDHEPYYVEFRNRWPDGSTHWLAGQGEVRCDARGAPLRMVGTVVDITERKTADNALRRSEEELRRSAAYLAEGQRLSHTGSWAWNVSTGELFWSREHFHICGLDPSVKPSYPMALQWVHPEDRSSVQHAFDMAIRERREFEQECRIVRPDGTIRHIRSLAHPVFSDAGDLTEYIGTIIDVTERREAEWQLSQLSGRLLQVQDEERRRLARELHDSTAQALTALSLRLAVLEGDAMMFSREAKHALADSHDLLGQVSREIRSLSYLLHPPFLDELGLGSAVPWYLDGFFQRSGIKVQAELPPAMPRLSTDIETTLFRIIQECLTNILKHSGSPTAALRIALTEKDVMLEVKDQGKGFPTAILGSSHNVVFSVGVGIMGMRERVRQLHGRLDIDSGEWGTRVTATLPVSSVVRGVA